MPTHKYVLVGPRAGKTENLAGHPFIGGVLTHDSKYRLPELNELTTYLARAYNAHPEGSTELRMAEEAWEDIRAEMLAAPKPTIQATGKTWSLEAIRELVEKLDPDSDADWANNGMPGVDAVSKLAGGVINRKQIAQAAPGYSRDSAKALR